MTTAPHERNAAMTTFRKIAFAATLAAGLLTTTTAFANDITSDRYYKTSAQPARHPVAAAVAAPAQEAKVEQASAAKAMAMSAHDCSCAHKS